MRLRTAVLVLRLPLGRASRWRLRSLVTVLRAADAGAPTAVRAVANALDSLGPETVWRTWAEPPVAGPTRRRWASPLVTELLADSTPVPDALVDAAWRDWFDAHEARLWSLLRRWDRAATISESEKVRALSRLALGDDGGAVDARLLAEAAARFDHPIGERARARLLVLNDTEVIDLYCAAAPASPKATAFCVEHHLAPTDEVERAVFFVRTGQHEQYRALDPEGTLLALGYRGASTELRSALREVMTGLGGIDTLRVLAGQSSRQEDFASLDGQERAYLIQQLKEQGDWNRLWQFTLLMPLSAAVLTVRAFGAWQPSGEDDRHVFEALRAADPQAVNRCMSVLSGVSASSPAPPHTRIRLADLDERLRGVTGLDFAPDGTQLALVGAVGVGTEGDGPLPSGEPVAWAGIVDLGSGTLSRLHCDFTYPLDWVAHLGSDTMVVGEADPYADTDAVDMDYSHKAKIHYVDSGGVWALGWEADEICGLERIAGDRAFVVSAWVEDWDDDEHPALFIGGPGGSLVASGVLDDLEEDFEPAIVAVDPDGRLVAMVDVLEAAVVIDLGSSVVNELDDGSGTLENVPVPPAALSPSTFVSCSEAGDLKVWHEPLTSREPSMTIPAWSAATPPDTLAWSPALNRFVAVDFSDQPHLELLDVPPTRDAPMPDELVSERMALAGDIGVAPIARLSPKGDVLAVRVGGPLGLVDLYDLTTLTLRPFIARPMGQMSHQELTHVAAVLENPQLDRESRTTLTLLRACLKHRFRHDVGIRDAVGPAVAGGFEIELGEV
ncbi:hypothetical protein [Streptomyces lanatus]|uniref:Uncharacterized protein n=1 Tax=Streptomyces lanatus TaxID=66900 RepID=A0ABV1XLD0_9ACTN|nr:hypothetical protein [Streptomyces lanatus]GHG98841.1 hypothetical protein GCM10018780_24970 [Streptomyces lanatus]